MPAPAAGRPRPAEPAAAAPRHRGTPPSRSRLDRAPSPVLVLGAIVSVQFGSATAATIFDRVGPAGAVLLRLLTASLVLCLLWRPAVRRRSAAEWRAVALFGFVLAGMNFAFYGALHRIPLGIAVTLEFVGPLAVAVGGSRRRLDLVWIALALAGILLLSGHGAAGGLHGGPGRGLDGTGVALALLAGAFWAAYILVSHRVGRMFPAGDGLALAMVIGTVALLPFGIAAGGDRLLEGRSLLLGGAVGLLSSAIPYSLELEALRRIRPSVFGVLMSLEPGVAALAGLIVLGQGLSLRAAAGILLVVGASLGAARATRRPPLDG